MQSNYNNLGNFCTATSGRRPKKRADGPTNYFSLGGKHITKDNRIDIGDDDWFLKESDYDKSSKGGKIEESCILLVKDGATIGKIALHTQDESNMKYAINEHLYKITTKNEKELRGLYNLLSSKYGKTQIDKCITGSAQPGLNRRFLRFIRVPTDDSGALNCDTPLANELDKLYIDSRNYIDKASVLLESIFEGLFAQNSENECFESDVGMLPKGSECMIIGDVIESISSGSRPSGGAVEEGVVSIGAENVLGVGIHRFDKEKYVPVEYFEKMEKNPNNRGIVENRDVLLYKDGAKLGRVSLVGNGFPHEKCCVNEHIFILRTNEHCSQIYLYCWLKYIEKEFNYIGLLNSNSAQPGINSSKVKRIPIAILPPQIMDVFESKANEIVNSILDAANMGQKCIEMSRFEKDQVFNNWANVIE